MGSRTFSRPSLQYAFQLLLFCVTYVVVARLGLLFAAGPSQISPVWPLAGLALFILIRWGLHLWPAILIGDLVVGRVIGYPLTASLGATAGATLEAVATAWLLRRRFGQFVSPAWLSDTLALILFSAFVGVPLGATCALLGSLLGSQLPWETMLLDWRNWWVADTMGHLLVTPPLLLWGRQRLPRERRRLLEGALLLVVLGSITLTIFSLHLSYVYLLFVPLLWAALRFGPAGTTLSLLLVSAIAIWATWRGAGPFASQVGTSALFFVQAFLGVLTATSLVLSALIAERQRDAVALRLSATLGNLLTQAQHGPLPLDDAVALLGRALGGWVTLDILTDDKERQRVALWGDDPELAAQWRRVPRSPESPLAAVLREGTPRLWERVPPALLAQWAQDEPRHRLLSEQLPLGSLAVAPLLVRGQRLGVLALYGRSQDAPFRNHTLRLLSESARQLARALDTVRLEKLLAETQRLEAIGRMAGGVAHDFNNLLSVIQGNAALALQGLPASAPVREELEQIRMTASRASQLTQQLLLFARRQHSPTAEPLNLNSQIEALMPIIQRLVNGSVEVHTDFEAALGLVQLDSVQLDQLLLNLVINARDAMPGGGRLTLQSATRMLDDQSRPHPQLPPGRYVRLTVQDEGEGMAEEVMNRVFEPFFTTKGKGTGLGLATCYGIVRRAGGHIAARSTPGRGSTFELFLPCVEPLQAAQPLSAEPQPARATETVLLVEDEAGVRDVSARILRRQGYEVIEAQDGTEALALAQQVGLERVDLLLVDMHLPSMDGTVLLAEVRRLAPTIPVILMSGAHVEHPPTLAETIMYLPKPFAPTDLVRSVRSALRPPAA